MVVLRSPSSHAAYPAALQYTIMIDFQGFSPKTLDFFRKIDRNNNRDWFTEHREEYIRHVQEPMKALVAELGPMVRELDPEVSVDPNRAVSRIYRDTRFSKDKSPYRPRSFFAFKRNVQRWSETPTFFFQVDATQYLWGVGMYCATAATMRRFRSLIEDDPDRFLRIVEPIHRSRSIALESEKYARPLTDALPPALMPWYQSKSIAVIGYRKPDKTLYSSKLVDFLMDRFVQLKLLYDFLWKSTVL